MLRSTVAASANSRLRVSGFSWPAFGARLNCVEYSPSKSAFALAKRLFVLRDQRAFLTDRHTLHILGRGVSLRLVLGRQLFQV